MKARQISIPVILALFSLITTGCVTRVTLEDESRRSVRFSTPESAKIFYDAYIATLPIENDKSSIRIPVPYWQMTVPSENTRFNSAVQIADNNRDGVISEEEARVFAGHEHTDELAFSNNP